MKVALIRPNYKSHIITPPLGLAYLSSFLIRDGHEVLIIDGLNLNLSTEEIITRAKNYPIIGITVLTDFYLQAKELTGKFKELDKTVVLGGVHPTVLPKETLIDTGADFIVAGEGEQTMAELVNAIRDGKQNTRIKGVYSKERPDEFTPGDLLFDLDQLPLPDWAQIDPRQYQKAPHGAIIKKFPVAPIVSSRGCPYECTFCASPRFWGKKIRFRSPVKVVDEIEYLVKNFGVNEIHFEDDNLTLKKDHIEKICYLILKRGLKIFWATPNGIRADKVDEELFKLMKKSGCYYVVFGIESGNQEILNKIKKRETLEEIEKAIRLASKVGLMTQGFFIFGLPGETEETIKNSIKFAKRVPLDRAQFLLYDMLPGSKLWEEHKNEYKIDNSKRSYQDITWVPDTISPEKLKKWQPKAFKKFFFRPRPLISLVKYFKLSQIKYIINRLKDFSIIN